jgi:hypothetical protein
MLIKAGLSSNPLSPTLTIGLVLILAVVVAENSQRVLSAMASKSGVKLLLIWLTSDEVVGTFLSLALKLWDSQRSLSEVQN